MTTSLLANQLRLIKATYIHGTSMPIILFIISPQRDRVNFLPPFDRWEKWGIKKGTDLPKINQLVNDTVTLRTQFFWPQVLHSFCLNLMAFVWAVSQLCNSRACRQEGSNSGSDCFRCTSPTRTLEPIQQCRFPFWCHLSSLFKEKGRLC